MRKIWVIAITLVFWGASVAHAVDKVIADGFNEWAKGGVTAAFTSWAKGGPLDGTKELLAQASQFGQIGSFYGGYIGYEVIDEMVVGKNTKIVYAMANLETGPLFGRFVLYKKKSGEWISPNFKFHTEPEPVWPSEVMVKGLKK